MPVREYYKGELVNLNWDFVDALAGGGGAVAGGAGGSQIDGLPVTGGLGGLGTVVGLGLSTLRTRDLLMFLEDYQLTKEEHERRFEGLEYGAFTVEGQIDFGTMEPRFTFFIDSDIGNAYRLNFNQYRVHLVRRSDGHTFFWGVTEKESYGLKWTVEVVPGGTTPQGVCGRGADGRSDRLDDGLDWEHAESCCAW